MKKIVNLTIFLILILFAPLLVTAQTERIIISPPINGTLQCDTQTDNNGFYQVFLPYPSSSVRVVSSRRNFTESINNNTTISFEYNPSMEIASCTPQQNGFVIEIKTRNNSNNSNSSNNSSSSNRSTPNTSASNQNSNTNQNSSGGNSGNSNSNNSGTGSTGTSTQSGSNTQNQNTSTSLDLTNKEKSEGKKKAADLSVPESPGFTILGLTPQTVVRPTSPRDFATALLNGLDENGNIQTGVAVDVAPYLLFRGKQLVLGTKGNKDKNIESSPGYRTSYVTRLLSRTQFSLATVKGASEADKSTKVGAGLHVTIYDNGDSKMDELLDACFNDFQTKIRAQAEQEFPNNETDEAEFDKYTARLTELADTKRAEYIKQCIEPSRKRNFAKSSFVIGGAGSWISKNGASSKFTNNGAGIWTSFAYGFEGIQGLEEKTQLILHFRRRYKEEVPDPLNEGMFITKDSNLFGARFRFGSPDWTGNIEGIYQGEHYAGRKADSNFKMSFGSDYRIAPNLYLNFSIGGETKKSNISDKKVFVKTSFNWGVSKETTQ